MKQESLPQEPKVDAYSMQGSNTQSFTMTNTTATKAISLTIPADAPRGKYLVMTTANRVIAGKIEYESICYNGNSANILLNTPPACANLVGCVNITDSMNSIDLYCIGNEASYEVPAWTLFLVAVKV